MLILVSTLDGGWNPRFVDCLNNSLWCGRYQCLAASIPLSSHSKTSIVLHSVARLVSVGDGMHSSVTLALRVLTSGVAVDATSDKQLRLSAESM